MPDYTKLTNLEVTGHLKVAGQEVTPGGGGGGGGVLVVHDVEGTLDKTWQEINDAPFAVVRVDITDEWSQAYVNACYVNDGVYHVGVANDAYYAADSANGYPIVDT